MIVVTGGAGFIGSNLVRALNSRGRADIEFLVDYWVLAHSHEHPELVDTLSQRKVGVLEVPTAFRGHETRSL